ncbi:MAG: universal stress protein [Planctomycetes bacterium]|nr:universal stress protein [Planctomycetota bacterium]
MKLDTVLVGIDELPRAEAAVRAGLALAGALEARARFVHAVPVPLPVWPDVDTTRLVELNEASVAAAREHLAGALDPLLREAGAKTTVAEALEVLPGNPSRVLVDHAEDVDADLIVLGPHKRRALFDFGSTARGVLSQVHCSVWVQPREYTPVRRILAPIDLSEPSLAALRMSLLLARELGATLDTLYCFDAPEFSWGGVPGYPDAGPAYLLDESREAVEREYHRVLDELDWAGVEHRRLFEDGAPVARILEHQGEYDLVSLGTHGRTGFAAAVLGSVAYACLKQSELPVLAIRYPERCWKAGA